jgi:hypothetical protein
MLESYGTIGYNDRLAIETGTPGFKLRQDTRTIKKWAKEYDEVVLQNLEKLSQEHEHVLTSYFVVAPLGFNLIKKTD